MAPAPPPEPPPAAAPPPPPPPPPIAPTPTRAPEPVVTGPGLGMYVGGGIALASAVAFGALGAVSLTKNPSIPAERQQTASGGTAFLAASGVLLASGIMMITLNARGLVTDPGATTASSNKLRLNVAVGPTNAAIHGAF